MAKAYDVTTPRDNKYAILRPCCRFWLMFVFANHDDETQCGLCRMCVKKQDESARFWATWNRAGV